MFGIVLRRKFFQLIEFPLQSNYLRTKCIRPKRHFSIGTNTAEWNRKFRNLTIAAGCGGSLLLGAAYFNFASKQENSKQIRKEDKDEKVAEELANLPVEIAQLTSAPNVPAPIKRNHPVKLVAKMDAQVVIWPLMRGINYRGWAFNKTVPGPFIRAREGDVLEIQFTNRDEDGVAHNIDFHAASGPGGGSPLLFAEKDETKVARFKLLYPGLYFYHCAAAPIPQHIAAGMYGLVLVEPPEGMPEADKEFYVMQSEFYTQPALEAAAETGANTANLMEYSYTDGINENPQAVVFNGREGALTERPLMAKTGERVRIYFGNAGPNLISSFHVIGTIFDRVYREGGLMEAPARGIQTTLVPAGGATVVELIPATPGTFTILDHAIHRIDKGAVGYLKVSGGPPRKDVYDGDSVPTPCPDCKLHE